MDNRLIAFTFPQDGTRPTLRLLLGVVSRIRCLGARHNDIPTSVWVGDNMGFVDWHQVAVAV